MIGTKVRDFAPVSDFSLEEFVPKDNFYRRFDGHGNTAGKVLRPIFTKSQLRRLGRDNEFSLDSPPSMLTVNQWASVFDLMVRLVLQERWPSSKRHAKRERGRC
jgi:hypothetical protein